MNFSPPPSAPFASSTPRFLEESQNISSAACELSKESLAAILKTNPKITNEAKDDYSAWGTSEGIPAIFGFEGMAFKKVRLNEERSDEQATKWRAGNVFNSDTDILTSFATRFAYQLEGRTMSATSLTFAHEKLRFLDPVYGVLKAGDNIKKYRMELTANLDVGEGGAEIKLDKFWRSKKVSDSLLAEYEGNGGILFNAASKEYSDLINFSVFESAGVEVSKWRAERRAWSREKGVGRCDEL